MRKLALGIAVMLGTSCMCAQSITPKELNEIRASFKLDEPTKALQNVISNNKNLKELALNREELGKYDHFFKYRVDVKGITDQKQSGRCWMFTSMNVLRPSIMEKFNINSFDFSHNYLFFWDQFEKANLFLENAINTAKDPMDDRAVVEYFKAPVADGGVWNLYYNLAKKYGVVPKEVMPETAHSESTSQVRSILIEKLRTAGYELREMVAQKKDKKALEATKIATLKDVYRILALTMGEPPVEFTWRFKDKSGKIQELKDYTPQQFYKDITPDDYSSENYVMIMNDPTREYYKVYEIENYRNTIEGINWIYLNLPNADIKKAALASIKSNEAMYISCDVGKYQNRDAGMLDVKMFDYESLFGVKLNMDKKARILTRQSGSSHAMLLIGCDTDDNDKPVKWEVENSWGAKSGNHGYLSMTNEWFEEYMFRFVIHRKHLDEKAINSLKEKPIVLPVWDYMY